MLSVVIIGRNEAANLERLASSIDKLKEYVRFPVETIFVDSASTDGSAGIAGRCFDLVLQLAPSPHLCASAGRYVGTLEARYPYVLYLDGDMDICPEFFPVVSKIHELEPEWAGVIGFYIHCFDNGQIAVQTFARRTGNPQAASQFGGAVILRRQAVLHAGNWDPSLYGKEEMELYVRLGNGTPVVKFVREPMIRHYSEHHSRLTLFKRLLYPSAGLGKVFWGFGQSIRALSIKQKLLSLVRLDFEPYIFWCVVLVAVVGALAAPGIWSGILPAVLMAIMTLWLRPGSILRYLTLPLSLVTGWFRYFPWFRPLLVRWIGTER